MEILLQKLNTYLTYQENAPLIFNTGLFLVLFIIFYAIYILTKEHKTSGLYMFWHSRCSFTIKAVVCFLVC